MRPEKVAILKQFEKSLKNCLSECVQYSLFCIKYIRKNATFRTKFRFKKKKVMKF